MRHRPKSFKGLLRRWIIAAVEYLLGLCFMLGALFSFCAAVGKILNALGVG